MGAPMLFEGRFVFQSEAQGKDDAGGALGFVWSIGAQRWFDARFSARAGPAAVRTAGIGVNVN